MTNVTLLIGHSSFYAKTTHTIYVSTKCLKITEWFSAWFTQVSLIENLQATHLSSRYIPSTFRESINLHQVKLSN